MTHQRIHPTIEPTTHPAEPVAQNVRTITEFEERALADLSLAERVGSAVARVIGTTTFAALHLVWFAAWIVINVGLVSGVKPFDPFPFSLLTTTVSLEAILLSIVVMISQNRITRQAQRRAHLDLQINLLAEAESSKTLSLLAAIAEHLGVDKLEIEKEEIERLAAKTDVSGLASKVAKIPDGA